MGRKEIWLVALALASVTVACNKSDDDDYDETDPRICNVSVRGISTTFVVNDVEGVIFNYDSLAYGTSVKALSPSFYGYNASTRIEYEKDGKWVAYSNSASDTIALDLTHLKIRSTSVNGKNTKEYLFSVRVHQFDVNALKWEKISTFANAAGATSQHALLCGGTYVYLYTLAGGKVGAYTSADGVEWTEKTVTGLENADCATAAVSGGKIVVAGADGGAWSATAAELAFEKETMPDGLKMIKPLFTLQDYFWAVVSDGESTLLLKGEQGAPLSQMTTEISVSAGFPAEGITAQVERSGVKTQVGYVYGNSADGATLWAIDGAGNVSKISDRKSGLPSLKNVAMATIDSELGLIGGSNGDGVPQKTYYTSTDGGLAWSENWHKELPKEMGETDGATAFVTPTGKLLLVGGAKNEKTAPAVWLGTLNAALGK